MSAAPYAQGPAYATFAGVRHDVDRCRVRPETALRAAVRAPARKVRSVGSSTLQQTRAHCGWRAPHSTAASMLGLTPSTRAHEQGRQNLGSPAANESLSHSRWQRGWFDRKIGASSQAGGKYELHQDSRRSRAPSAVPPPMMRCLASPGSAVRRRGSVGSFSIHGIFFLRRQACFALANCVVKRTRQRRCLRLGQSTVGDSARGGEFKTRVRGGRRCRMRPRLPRQGGGKAVVRRQRSLFFQRCASARGVLAARHGGGRDHRHRQGDGALTRRCVRGDGDA